MKTLTLIVLISIFLNSSCSSDKNDKIIQNTNEASTNTSKDTKTSPPQKTELMPSSDTLTVALTLLRKGNNISVGANEVFTKDDGVRLNISTVENGFLYILYKSSDGAAQILFPSKEYFNGKNEIEPNKTLVIPNKGWFFFDKKKGTETVFVVYSKIRNSKILSGNAKESMIQLQKIQSANGNREVFTTEEGDLIRVIQLKHQ